MSVMASQITGVLMGCSNVSSGADQRKHQSSMSLAFVRGIFWWQVNSPQKGPVTQKMFPFDDIIVELRENLPCYNNTAAATAPFSAAELSSFSQNFHHWLQRKLSKWWLPTQPMMEISSWWQFLFQCWSPTLKRKLPLRWNFHIKFFPIFAVFVFHVGMSVLCAW